MRRFLPFAALVGVALVLACQDVGTGPVGPDGLESQFHHSEGHDKGGGDGGPGGGPGGGKILGFATFTGDIVADDPTLVTIPGSTVPGGGNFLIEAITPTGSTIVMRSGYSVTHVKAGKIISLEIWVSPIVPFGDADKKDIWHINSVPVDPPVPVDTDIRLHLHADGLELFGGGGKRGDPPIGTISVVDVVYIPPP